MHRFLLGIPIVLAVAGTTAAAAETSLLAGLDTNGDGVVTRAEFDAARRRDFRLLDRNGNKVLSRHEFYRRGEPADRTLLALRQRRYRLMDVNDDGGITLAEYLAYGHKVFARMDRDRDRRLTVGEVAAARGVQVATNDTGPGQTTPARMSQPTSTPPASKDSEAARALGDMPFATVDRNGDGYISRAEYRHAALNLFRRLDRNHNLVLSRHEYYWRDSANDKARLAARKVAYRRADENDDGGLTGAEFLKMTGGLFARIDHDKDHRLSRAEWTAAFGATTTMAKADPVRPGGRLRLVRSLRTELIADATRVAPAAETTPPRTATTPPPKAMPAAKTMADKKPAMSKTEPGSALLAQMKASRAKVTRVPQQVVGPAPKTQPQVAARPPATMTPAKPAKPTTDPRIIFAFRGLDTNHDNKISEFELKLARMSRFNILDANRDRVLQASEFIANRGAAAAARFREMDRDGNGLVTWDEYSAAGIQRFRQLDTNADKFLSLEEFANAGRVNSTNVRYVKRVKVPSSPEAKKVETRKPSALPPDFNPSIR